MSAISQKEFRNRSAQIQEAWSIKFLLVELFIPIGSRSIAFPMFSFSTSCIVFAIFLSFLDANETFQFGSFTMFNYAYMAIAAGCSLHVYHGFIKKKLSNFYYWGFVKFLELLMLLGGAIYFGVLKYIMDQLDVVILQAVLFLVTVLEVVYIVWKSKIIRKANDEKFNMYDEKNDPTIEPIKHISLENVE